MCSFVRPADERHRAVCHVSGLSRYEILKRNRRTWTIMLMTLQSERRVVRKVYRRYDYGFEEATLISDTLLGCDVM